MYWRRSMMWKRAEGRNRFEEFSTDFGDKMEESTKEKVGDV